MTVRVEGGGTSVNAEYRFVDFWSRSNLPCVCVCLCALSHLFTACGAQTNRTERWLTASLVWLLISGEWGPVGALCQPVKSWALCVSQSYSVGAVCQPICAAVLSVTCHGLVVMVTVSDRAEECSLFRRLADDHLIIRVSLR